MVADGCLHVELEYVATEREGEGGRGGREEGREGERKGKGRK